MAVWGLIGYAVVLVGAIVEVLGYGVGVALSVPGGLVEIGLGALPIMKGFSSPFPRSNADVGRYIGTLNEYQRLTRAARSLVTSVPRTVR